MNPANTAPAYPWLQHYPQGVPTTIDPDKYHSVLDLLESGFRDYADRVAFYNMGKTITYRELEVQSRNFAAWLQAKGLKKGDRIAIQMPNLLQFPVVMFGALRAGLIVVNTNPLYTPREMEHQFRDSGAVAIVILANFADKLDQVIAKTNIKTVIVSQIGDMLGGMKGAIVNFVVKRVRKMVPNYSLPGHHKLKQVLNEAGGYTYSRPEVSNQDLAFLQYTGGTTGLSKGASLTHRNILANMEQIFAWVSPLTDGGKTAEIIITALPLYHIFALTVNCLAFFSVGGKNVLITNPRDIPGFIKELRKHKFSVFTGINTLFAALMNHAEFSSIDFRSLKLSLGGGMALQDVVVRRWEKLTQSRLAEAYGLSEASPGVTANPLTDAARIGTVGVPLPSTEVIVATEAGEPLPAGERGELLVNGPQVMQGYWHKPEENEKVFVNGYLRTGDIAIMSEDGFFKIVDRKKEMILVSGFNVFPNEVEGVIVENPKVLEVGVTAAPHEKSGECVAAYIVKKDPSLTREEIVAFCRERLTGYKVPKVVEFREELPKSNVGKILRRKLREPND
ncbi:MAG: AMP-binding protein [Bacteroidota bacterium]